MEQNLIETLFQTIRFTILRSGWLKKCPICIICFVIFVLIALVAIILGLIPIYVSSSGEARFANIGVRVNNAFRNDLQSTNLFLAISSNDSNQTNATSADVNTYVEQIQNQVRRDIIHFTKFPCEVTVELAPVLSNTATSVSVRRKRDDGCDAVAGQNILIGSINVQFFGPTNLVSNILSDSLSNPSSYLNIQQTVCNGLIVPTNTSTSSSTVAATTLTITTSTSSTTTTTTLTTTTLTTSTVSSTSTGSTVTTPLTTTTLTTSTVSSTSTGSTVTTPLTTTATTLKTTTSTLSTTTLTTSKVSSTSAASTTTSEIISSSPSSEFTSSPFSTFTSESSSFSF